MVYSTKRPIVAFLVLSLLGFARRLQKRENAHSDTATDTAIDTSVDGNRC